MSLLTRQLRAWQFREWLYSTARGVAWLLVVIVGSLAVACAVDFYLDRYIDNVSEEGTSTLDFEPPGPGSWNLDPVHFPRPVTRYFAETHPAPFRRGTHEFMAFYGTPIDAMETQYVNGFAYNTMRPAADEEIPQRFARAEEVWERKVWREQLHEWDETFKPAAIEIHRELQAVDPDSPHHHPKRSKDQCTRPLSCPPGLPAHQKAVRPVSAPPVLNPYDCDIPVPHRRLLDNHHATASLLARDLQSHIASRE